MKLYNVITDSKLVPYVTKLCGVKGRQENCQPNFSCVFIRMGSENKRKKITNSYIENMGKFTWFISERHLWI